MRTRIFKGESLPAVLLQVREECGEDVVIITTRERGYRQVEIEVGLVSAKRANQETLPAEQPSLALLADLSVENDIFGALSAQGVSADIQLFCEQNLPNKGDAVEKLAKALSKVVVFDGKVPFASRCVVVMGPPQGGKTTAIVKLAARLQEALVCKIGIVSAESGSKEHNDRLAAYAELLDIPMEMVDSALDASARIPAAVSRLEACDLIFIDTPGVDVRDADGWSDLSALLEQCRDMEKLLVLPASQDAVTLRLQAQRYDGLGATRMVLSKIDENGLLGAILNVAHECEIPVGFISAGDRIPQDIEPASARRIAALLLRRMH
jgi:flagellar biosynthesis protein FlhF